MKLIVWLGNPWSEYAKTRHNMWFIMIDLYCKEKAFSGWKFEKKFNADVIKTENIIFCKPQTFMNKSWESIKKISDFYKIKIEDILIIHDEIDLPIGKIQKKIGWSPAGHNWLKSILQELQNENTFTRIRVGIDRPLNKEDVVNYVLQTTPKNELAIILQRKEDVFLLIENFLNDE